MANPRKTIAPIKSYFQEIKAIPNKTNEGIRCIKNGNTASQPLYSEKTSNENKDKNIINPILKILGSQ